MHGVEKMGEEEGNVREDIEADGDDDSVEFGAYGR